MKTIDAAVELDEKGGLLAVVVENAKGIVKDNKKKPPAIIKINEMWSTKMPHWLPIPIPYDPISRSIPFALFRFSVPFFIFPKITLDSMLIV